jgi:hypothetical protein
MVPGSFSAIGSELVRSASSSFSFPALTSSLTSNANFTIKEVII